MTKHAEIVDLAKTRDCLLTEFRAVCGDVNPRGVLDAHWPTHFLKPRDPMGDWSTPHAELHAGLRGCRECAIALAVIWIEGVGKPDVHVERVRKLLELRDHLEKARLIAVDLDAGEEFENRLIDMVCDVDEASIALPYWNRLLSRAKKQGAGRPSKKDLGGLEYILHDGGDYPLKRISELVFDGDGGVDDSRVGRTEKRIKRYRESLSGPTISEADSVG